MCSLTHLLSSSVLCTCVCEVCQACDRILTELLLGADGRVNGGANRAGCKATRAPCKHGGGALNSSWQGDLEDEAGHPREKKGKKGAERLVCKRYGDKEGTPEGLSWFEHGSHQRWGCLGASRLLETQFRGHGRAGGGWGVESWLPLCSQGLRRMRAEHPGKVSGPEDVKMLASGMGRILPRLGTSVAVGLGLHWEGLNLTRCPSAWLLVLPVSSQQSLSVVLSWGRKEGRGRSALWG